MKRSISLRLAAMFAITSLLVFSLVGVGLLVTMEKQLFAELRATLDMRSRVAHMIVSHPYPANHWHIVAEKLTDLQPPDGSTLYYVDSADPAYRFGTPIVGTPDKPADGPFQRLRMADGYDVLTHTERVPANGPRPALELTVATSCKRTHLMLQRLALTLAGFIAVATLITVLLSGLVARFSLAPLARLRKEAGALSPANRRQRLHTEALPSELHDLAVSFNGALGRIEQAYDRLESFNADVAHELRTPISILIGQTQVALSSRERSAEKMQQTLQSNLEEFERLRVIVNDMLFLSRSDRGERATDLTEVSLANEVQRMVDFLAMLFEDAQVTVEVTGQARATLDPSLFGRAVANLLINALQHTAAGGKVRVAVSARDDRVEVAVSNPGEPIAQEVQAQMFERFYRLEEARVNSGENHGLGLSIVRAVAGMHGGDAFVTSRDGINTFGFSMAARQPIDPRAHARQEISAGQPANSGALVPAHSK